MSRDVVSRYMRAGFAPIPVPSRSKNPNRQDWQNERFTERDLHHFSNGCNVGLLLGEPSGHLVDVDLDCREAVEAAVEFLPPTGMVQGRPSRRRSHLFYRCAEAETEKFLDVSSRGVAGGQTLVEIRSTGCQTIVAPSTHPSGEKVTIEMDGDPAEVDADKLREAVRKSAAAALLARHWPDGARHDFSLPLAGFLLRCGVARESLVDVVRVAAEIAGDGEIEDRIRAIEDTAAVLERGESASGFPTVVEILGEDKARQIGDRLQAWLCGKPECEPCVAPTRTPVAPFPIEILPPSLQDYVHEVSTVLNCPPDFVAGPMIVVASTAIGGSAVIEPKSGWREGPTMYWATVGRPGSGKTPAQQQVVKPLRKIAMELSAEFESQREAHESELLIYDQELRDWKKHSTGAPPQKPEKPLCRRVITSDATVEALARILQENPEGICVVRDEIAGWVRALDQYKGGRGADRQFFLSAWSRETIVVDRVSRDDPLVVQSPALCVLGGIQPELLGELQDERGRQDGFLDRILFSFPDERPPPIWNDTGISSLTELRWENIVHSLHAMEMRVGENGEPLPTVWRLGDGAKVIWRELFDEISSELASPDFPSELAGVSSKLRSYALRLGLVCQLLYVATEESDADGIIEERALLAAAALVEYLQSHARKVYRHLRHTHEDRALESAVEWIRRHGGAVPQRDLQRNNVGGVKSARELKLLVDELVDRGFARTEKRKSTGKGPASTWVVLRTNESPDTRQEAKDEAKP